MKRAISKSNKKKKQRGYSIVELLLAMGLFGLFAASIVFLVLGSFNSNRRAALLADAKNYLQESGEALHSISEEAFNNLTAGTYGLSYSAIDKKWSLISSADDPDDTGPFISRTILIEDVLRTEREVGEIGGSFNDPYMKKATITLTWNVGDGGTATLSSETYLADWNSDTWSQTDWSDVATYDSDDGNIDATSTPGQISLASTIIDDYEQNWDFSDASDYDLSDTGEIEITDSAAQLIYADIVSTTLNQGVEDGTGTYPDYWEAPMISLPALAAYYKWYSTGGYGDDLKNIAIWYPRRISETRYSYWQQTITTTDDDPDLATLTFKWKCTQYAGTPVRYKIMVNIDTSTGIPDESDAVWTQNITSTSADWQTATIDLASELATTGTYYLKISILLDYDPVIKTGPFEVAMDNIDLDWYKQTYATDSPYVENDTAWEPEHLGMLTSFTETASKDSGTEIYYQLSNDDGDNWYYYNTTNNEWQRTTGTDSNEAEDVDEYIRYFPVGDKQIKFRAYLSSDGGDHQVSLDNIELAGTEIEYYDNWDFNDDAAYQSSDSTELETTDGVAQLIEIDDIPFTTLNQGVEDGTGTYPDYWDAPSRYLPAYYKWYSTGGYGDDLKNIAIQYPRRTVGTRSTYWQQVLTITDDDPDLATLTFKWKCIKYRGTPVDFYLAVNIDTSAGDPDLTEAVWSQDITSTSADWQTATVDITDEMTTAGTYYLKLTLYLAYSDTVTTGPFEVAMDNIDLDWYKQTYATDSPYVENDTAWEPEHLGMLTSFTETASKDSGTEIYYQLSNDDGDNWYYYNTTNNEWQRTTGTDSNEAEDVDEYIRYFPVGDKQIKFRAYLSSDGGDHQVSLDNIFFEYNPDTITMETGTLTVDNHWQTVNLQNTYDVNGPVIVAMPWEYNNSDSPYSVRVKNVTFSAFDIRLEYPTDNYSPTDYSTSETVDYLAVEDGYWVLDDVTNTRLEAHRYTTSDCSGEEKDYELIYDDEPVLLHQLMSANEDSWATSWASSETDDYQSGIISNDCSSATQETIGAIAIENVGNDAFNGTDFSTIKNSASINGHDAGCAALGSYYSSPLAIGSQMSQSDADDGWLMRCGSTASPEQISMHIEEDQDADEERSHSAESIGAIIFNQEMSINGKAVEHEYQTSGWLVSSAFSTVQNFNLIQWEADDSCTDCEVKLQVRTADNQDDLSDAPWSEVFTDEFGSLLDVSEHLRDTWAQYRIELAGNGANSPVCEAVMINYY